MVKFLGVLLGVIAVLSIASSACAWGFAAGDVFIYEPVSEGFSANTNVTTQDFSVAVEGSFDVARELALKIPNTIQENIQISISNFWGN